jgi:hypothetical protein
MLLVRSLLFQAYFFVSVLLFAFAIFVSWALPFAVRFGLARTWAKSMLRAGRVLCGLE